MSKSERSSFDARQLLLSVLVGAVISVASVIAYTNSERDMPFLANFVISTVSLAAIPGYILSAYISGNIHNANLIIAGTINFIIYSGLVLWLINRRSRKRRFARPQVK
jgi:hypothetical protein